MHASSYDDVPTYLCGWRSRRGARTGDTGPTCRSVNVQRSLVVECLLSVLAEWADEIETAAAAATAELNRGDMTMWSPRRKRYAGSLIG